MVERDDLVSGQLSRSESLSKKSEQQSEELSDGSFPTVEESPRQM